MKTKQQPAWPDLGALEEVTARLAVSPALVAPGECDRLRDQLAAVARGEAFLLQGGDCAESFDADSLSVERLLRTLLQMAVILTYAGSVPVVKVGRIAGQYAKPRSSDVEVRDGVSLPVYRGDAVNGWAFTEADRRPDPTRLLRLHASSAATLNLMRMFTAQNAGLSEVHAWNQDFVAASPSVERYERMADDIDRALRFMDASGAPTTRLGLGEIFASHEGLLLPYERAMQRGGYATSGHLLWIGERTRDLDGAHVEFFAGIRNPIAVKLGPSTTPDEALALIDRLDPDRQPGRLTFITRMGASLVRERLPVLVEKVTASGGQVAWVCDPMHGNGLTAPSGHKTRRFADVLDEVRGFFEVHRALGTHPGGVHVEITGDDVTECVGGGHEIGFDDLHSRYESRCDPRLNRGQSLDLAFLVAEMLAT